MYRVSGEESSTRFAVAGLTVVRLWDKTKQHETSLSDSEDEGTGGRRHRQSHRDSASNGSRSKRRSRSPRSNGTSATPGPVAVLNAKAPAVAENASAPRTGTTIDSGLLDNPPTANALRTTKGPSDGDVEMADGQTNGAAQSGSSGGGVGGVAASTAGV